MAGWSLKRVFILLLGLVIVSGFLLISHYYGVSMMVEYETLNTSLIGPTTRFRPPAHLPWTISSSLVPSSREPTPQPASSTTVVPSTTTIKPVSELKFLNVPDIVINTGMSPQEAENEFYRFAEQRQIDCPKGVRLGHQADGGWDMCVSGPYKPTAPCTVYSFGINNDWSFDDSISGKYGCEVKAFDPSMKVQDHKHSALVYFYKTGIGGKNTVNNKGWKIRTLGSLLKQLGDDDKVIDYLKVDIEYNEWDSFQTIFDEHDLSRVKQFGFEFHTHELYGGSPTTVRQFVHYWEILKKIETFGFKRWYTHANPLGPYHSRRTHRHRTCCYELVYVNTNFLKGTPSNLPAIELPTTTVKAPPKPRIDKPQPGQKDLPEGLRYVKKTSERLDSSMAPREAEEAFYRYVTSDDIECSTKVRIGNSGDGGWEICTVGPYDLKEPCLVYSFGINNEWSFDDGISRKYGCEVKAFDPSMHRQNHQHSSLVQFFNLGIGGNNRRNERGWELKTLGSIITDLQHSTKVIDYLKIDVEYSEWESFRGMFTEQSLQNVKQFAFEIHTDELNHKVTTVDQFVSYHRALKELEAMGFRKWHNHYNPYGRYISRRTGQSRTCCYELYYININFLENS